jgi:hypothetical protein
MVEGRVTESEHELRQKFVRRQEAFDPVLFLALRIEDQRRRRPLRVVLLPQALELGRLVADVNPRRKEVLDDEPGDSLIGIDLGIQPSASLSRGRRAEVQQDRLSPGARFLQQRLDVVPPRNRHGQFPHNHRAGRLRP